MENTNPIEEAKKLLNEEKQQRAKDFDKELKQLEEKFKCKLVIQYQQQSVLMPSIGTIAIEPLDL